MVISDLHLGKKSAAADMLYECLQHVSFDRLILNGDIIDGWVLMKKAHRKLPEMQKRVLDILNARIAAGVEVIYIPGNHDEKLRRLNISGKTFFGIRFEAEHKFTDPAGRKFLALHGDRFDPNFIKDKAGLIYRMGDMAYDGLIEVNAVTSLMTHKVLKKRFSLAAYAKKKTKDIIGIIDKFEDVVAAAAAHEEVDGVLCGHIHHAEISNKYGVMYGNSGDWVESSTALTCDEHGNWNIMEWLAKRHEFGLSTRPQESDVNPYSTYRETTERQLRLIQKLWPARDRAELLDELYLRRKASRKAAEKVYEHKRALTL